MAETTSPISAKPDKPFWLPDTQGFLAIAIISLIAAIVLVLLMRPITIDERTSGVLMTVIGVLTACLKDVYSFFFGSSRGSDKKDDALITQVAATSPPSTPPAAFNPPLTLKDGTVVRSIKDALSFATVQSTPTDEAKASLADILKILANGGTDSEKAGAFTKWAAAQGLI